MGVAIVVADNTYMCSFGSDGAATSFCVLACPLRQSSVYLSLSRGVVLGHSSTLCDQPRKAFTGHSVDVDILHISYACRHIYIVGERGRLFSSPMPAQRRGCISECDHPPYGGHDPTVAVCVV